MSGNEILLNMKNAQFFRDSELINSLTEVSKRLYLKQNIFLSKFYFFKIDKETFLENPYFNKAFDLTVKKIKSLNVKSFFTLS